ncbi:NAD(P)-binding domain-containing protein [Cellulomonas humilata]|uniref:NAD(P)-binding domain-containing protein n=1 Tax=Cellulomonas humilata TaxID=144055 RepID=A0A7Y6A2V7_9CELL|nr:NAD(P)-binding domain-containing protein [Cellulomonas humilata]
MTADCVVVGAGPAGLAASAALTARGIEHEVLERGRVGESWWARWDSFRLNTPGLLNPMLGPAADDEYTPRDDVVRRLEALASSCPVRTGVAVTALVPHPDGLTLETSAGPVRTRAVVVATGAENTPRVPAFAAGLPVAQQTTTTYRSPAGLPAGTVLVVGSGQSGVQVVRDLQAAGRRVLLATSTLGRLPSPYRGRPMIAWLAVSGFFDQRPSDVPPEVRLRPNPLVVPGEEGPDLRRMARDGLGLLGRVTGAVGGRLLVDGSARRNIAAGEEFAARACTLVDAVIDRLGLDAPPAVPEEDLTSFPVREGLELDLSDDDVSGIVWCTGMRGSHAWLPAELLDDRGVPRQRDGAADLPGLWFLGLRWMRRRGSSNFEGMPADAAAVARAVEAHLSAA